MKKIISLLFFTIFSTTTIAQQVSGVGINTKTPMAALDIKSGENNPEKILRFSTLPSDIPSTDEDFVFFVGDPVVENGNTVAYDLRGLTLTDFSQKINILFPSLNKITVTNSRFKDINRQTPDGEISLPLDTPLINTNDKVYSFDSGTHAIEFLEDGYYEITAFVGIETLYSFEGDILINVTLKGAGSSTYKIYKSTIISRTNNNSIYDQGTGVGSSFSFVNEFRKGDKIRLQVDGSNRPATAAGGRENIVKILSNGATLSVTRLSSLIN